MAKSDKEKLADEPDNGAANGTAAVATLLTDVSVPTNRAGTGVEVAHQLLAYISAGDIQAGQRLPGERALAETLGVGRSAIRDALKAMTVLGVLEVRQGDGTFVSGSGSTLLPKIVEWGIFLSDSSIQDLTTARTEIEVSLAGLAADNVDRQSTDRIVAEFRRMETACASGDVDEYADADISLHLAIGEASRNVVMSGVLTNIRLLLKSWTEQVLASEVSLQDSLALHRPIVEAIERRDGAGARAAMLTHMLTAKSNLERARLNVQQRQVGHGH